MKDDKFKVLDEVKAIKVGNEMAVTLSIGIGIKSDKYNENYEYAVSYTHQRCIRDRYYTSVSASEAYKIMENSIFCFGEYITVKRVTRSLLEIGNYFYIKRNVTFLNNEKNFKIKFIK